MTRRREFPKKVKLAAFERASGRCEGDGCGARLTPGKFAYDHVLPDALGGEPTLDNCAVLCTACHAEKTGKGDVPRIRKADRQRNKHLGIRGPKQRFGIPGLKKKIDGRVVPR
jgi:5-methylcytosine-specific restriction enzyme A